MLIAFGNIAIRNFLPLAHFDGVIGQGARRLSSSRG
jgi:hypothetical protein